MFKNDFNVEEGVHYFLTQTIPSRSRYYDFEKKEMRSSTSSLIYGVVNFDPLSQQYYYGFFSRNYAKNASVNILRNVVTVFDKKYLKDHHLQVMPATHQRQYAYMVFHVL